MHSLIIYRIDFNEPLPNWHPLLVKESKGKLIAKENQVKLDYFKFDNENASMKQQMSEKKQKYEVIDQPDVEIKKSTEKTKDIDNE